MADASSEHLEFAVVVDRVLAHSKPAVCVADVSQSKATWAASVVEIDPESGHLLLELVEVVDSPGTHTVSLGVGLWQCSTL
jgi:hypothetical protein